MTLVSQTESQHDCVDVGNRIREIREAQGLSQDVLADRLGTSRKQVSRHENGETEMGISAYFQYAEALGVDANALAPERSNCKITPLQWRLLTLTQDMCETDMNTVLMVAKRFHSYQSL